MKKQLAYKDDKSDKFWNIEVSGESFTVTYGKTGTAGQTQTKTFDSDAKCLREAEKLVNEKLKKGYMEDAGQTIQSPKTGEPEKYLTAIKKEIKKCVKNFIMDSPFDFKNIDLDDEGDETIDNLWEMVFLEIEASYIAIKKSDENDSLYDELRNYFFQIAEQTIKKIPIDTVDNWILEQIETLEKIVQTIESKNWKKATKDIYALVSYNRNINLPIKNNSSTILHEVVKHANDNPLSGSVIKLLLKNKADLTAKDKEGKMAVDYAKNPNIKDLLMKGDSNN